MDDPVAGVSILCGVGPLGVEGGPATGVCELGSRGWGGGYGYVSWWGGGGGFMGGGGGVGVGLVAGLFWLLFSWLETCFFFFLVSAVLGLRAVFSALFGDRCRSRRSV